MEPETKILNDQSTETIGVDYKEKIKEDDKLLLFVTLTQRCQLSCKYCGNITNADIEDLACHPPETTYDTNLLLKLANVKNLIICFYGGEPLLRIPLIEEIIELLPNATFCLQTNGLNLNKLKPETLHKMSTILVSIDGDEETTDFNRGKGTYAKLIKNVKFIKETQGFNGDLIARMTCGGISDIYKSVMHLLSLSLFKHVHWQIDCEWDSDMNSRYENFYTWRDEIYNPGISQLMTTFMEQLRLGQVMGITPFLGLIQSFLKNEKIQRIRCGAGSTSFNLTTGGLFNSCPIAPEFDPLANIRDDNFDHKRLYDSQLIGGSCLECSIFDKCGGRCLYANKTNWWGKEGHEAVCNTIFHLIKTVEENMEEIAKLAEGNSEVLDLLEYPKYNNTCEIIP